MCKNQAWLDKRDFSTVKLSGQAFSLTKDQGEGFIGLIVDFFATVISDKKSLAMMIVILVVFTLCLIAFCKMVCCA